MLPDSSDTPEDIGRMDSERQIRNKPTSRWLEDVVKLAESDCGEVVATIAGRKGEMDEMHDNFLSSLDTALAGEGAAKKSIDRKRQVRDLLSNADDLLAIYKSANDGIGAAFGGEQSLQAMRKTHEADVQKVKDVLLVGKRICAGELEAVEQQARARELMGRKEVFEQAAGIFGGGPKMNGGDEGVERTLGDMERGVRRMVRGLE